MKYCFQSILCNCNFAHSDNRIESIPLPTTAMQLQWESILVESGENFFTLFRKGSKSELEQIYKSLAVI